MVLEDVLVGWVRTVDIQKIDTFLPIYGAIENWPSCVCDLLRGGAVHEVGSRATRLQALITYNILQYYNILQQQLTTYNQKGWFPAISCKERWDGQSMKFHARISVVWSQCLLILMSGPVIALRQKSFHSSRSSSRLCGCGSNIRPDGFMVHKWFIWALMVEPKWFTNFSFEEFGWMAKTGEGAIHWKEQMLACSRHKCLPIFAHEFLRVLFVEKYNRQHRLMKYHNIM